MRRGPYRKHRWPKALEAADRKADGSRKKPPKRRHETVLLATSVGEYKKLQHEYPNMKITLDTSGQEQEQLFDTRGMVSNE